MAPKQLEPFCFWCGGNARYDFSSEPRPFHENKQRLCESCTRLAGAEGILLFEVTEQNPGCGNPELSGTIAYYTGRWTVIDAHMAAQIFPAEILPGVVAQRFAGVSVANYAKAGFNKYPWRTIQ